MSAPPEPARPAVLIVDDEPMNLELLAQELEVLGYTIEEARNGRDALDRCAARPPDVVLLDVMMPGMNRLGVSRKIEDDEARRKMRKALDELDLPARIGARVRFGAHRRRPAPGTSSRLRATTRSLSRSSST